VKFVLNHYKKYLGLHIASLGIAMVAVGTVLLLKEKKHEENCCH
jgi:hypothetical protein